MYRRFSAPPSRVSRPSRGPRGGFTLVELLVVITIIAMLVGLLVPAVMAARNAARKTQCMNNQQNLGKGILNYVTSKEKFPPLFSLQPDPMVSIRNRGQSAGYRRFCRTLSRTLCTPNFKITHCFSNRQRCRGRYFDLSVAQPWSFAEGAAGLRRECWRSRQRGSRR